MRRSTCALLFCIACGSPAPERVEPESFPPFTTGLEDGSEASTGDDGTTSTGGSSESTAAACVDSGTGDCCCFVDVVDDPSLGGSYVDNVCAQADLCESPYLSCPGTDETGFDDCAADEIEALDSDLPALDCMLDALAAGTPGRVSFDLSMDEGWAVRTHDLHIVGPGDAFHSARLAVDLSAAHEGVERWTLRPAADFEACRAGSTIAEKMACLLEPAAAVAEICLDPAD